MIPPFTENGYLPSGVHPAKLDEVEVRFRRTRKSGVFKWSRCDGWLSCANRALTSKGW